MLQAVLDNLKLQLSYRTDNLATVELTDKQLCHTFVHELANALVKLLLLHRVGILDILKHLWREGWQSLEVEIFACSQSVTNLEVACIWQTYYIACKSFIHRLLALRHEAGRSRESHLAVLAYVLIIGVTHELTATNLEESDT